jgi:glycosyltransferase involved in cell wall biosynthesis
MKLSAVMPVYNERATLREAVRKVLSVPLEIELITVDDGSRDGSREILAEELQSEYPQIRVEARAAERNLRLREVLMVPWFRRCKVPMVQLSAAREMNNSFSPRDR